MTVVANESGQIPDILSCKFWNILDLQDKLHVVINLSWNIANISY